MTINRIGFACKWIDHPDQVNGIGPKDDAKKYNTGATTVAWLNRQTREVAEQKLWDLMVQNIEATRLLVERVGKLEPELRMVRLSSDILPCYTEPTYSNFWRKTDVQRYCEQHFSEVGRLARLYNVRLSMHPGQFTVLASDRDDVVAKSIEEFEYHAAMAAWMGYGRSFQDFKINVHISGKRGTEGIRDVYGKLSPEARNTITIENEEISYGLDDCLLLGDLLPIVLDVHHHHIHSGEYIQATDDRIKKIIESWRGVRPVIHYSASREDVLVGHSTNDCPDLHTLLENGHKKGKLRAHSDFMWNRALNEWVYKHWQWADVMVEAKGKNLASFGLYEFWKGLKNPVSSVFESKANSSTYN